MTKEGKKPGNYKLGKNPGWFSRRHRTSEAHLNAKARKEQRLADQSADFNERVIARAKRSPYEQIKVLDEKLGKNQGAVKERARLKAQMEPKKGKKNGNKRRRRS